MLEDEIAAVLAEPLEGFVEARTARAKELRAAGQKEEAASLTKVRKPTRLLWDLVDLGRRHPDERSAAAAAAEDLAAAQSGEGGDVRELFGRFRAALGALTELADDPALGLALRSVLADPGAREAWVGGHLLTLPQDASDAAAPGRPTRRGSTGPTRGARRRAREDRATETQGAGATPPTAAAAGKDEVSGRRAEREARRLAEVAEAARRRDRDVVQRAEREWRTTEEASDALARQVDGLEQRIADLETELGHVQDDLEAAEQAEDEAARRLGEATKRLD